METGSRDGLTEPVDPPEDRSSLRSAALSGVILLTVRGLGINLIGLIGYLALARLLTPHDFGLAALGLGIVFFAHFVADAGLGAALIRRPEDPAAGDYASVVGIQFGVLTAAVVAVAAWFAVAQNVVAAVSLIYVASLPVLAFRVPSSIALERHLRYRPMVVADVSELVVSTAWSIGAVLAGFGVYGLASGAVVRTIVGTVVLNRLGPIGWIRPSRDLRRVRSLLGFGVTFQLSSAVTLARDQGLNFGTAALLGYTTLGLWTLVSRCLAVPLLVFSSLWRVSFPAMSRMLARGEDVHELMRRNVGAAGVLGGLVYVPMAIGLPPLIPAIVGARWAGALLVLPYILLGLLVAMPISVVASGFLLAKGDAASLLRVNVGISGLNLGVALVLMPLVGYLALGVAQSAAGVADAWLLSQAVHKWGGPPLFSRTIAPTLSAVLAFAVVAAAQLLVKDSLGWLVLAATLGAVIFSLSVMATVPTDVRSALRLVSGVRGRVRSR